MRNKMVGNGADLLLRQYRIILSADTASEVRQLRKPKAQIILDVLIEHFGNADAVPQPPERCLEPLGGELCGIALKYEEPKNGR